MAILWYVHALISIFIGLRIGLRNPPIKVPFSFFTSPSTILATNDLLEANDMYANLVEHDGSTCKYRVLDCSNDLAYLLDAN